jgi:ribonucleases P/MRP protein subunit RPP40
MYFNHLVTEGIEESGKGAAVFFDVKKASDSVPHKKLLERLQHFDLPANWLRLLQSYLRNRSFQVKIGQSYSSRRSSTSGVPQDSILGPLLFIAYADQLFSVNLSPDAKLIFYADDLAYIKPISTVEDQSELRRDIERLSQKYQDWY